MLGPEPVVQLLSRYGTQLGEDGQPYESSFLNTDRKPTSDQIAEWICWNFHYTLAVAVAFERQVLTPLRARMIMAARSHVHADHLLSLGFEESLVAYDRECPNVRGVNQHLLRHGSRPARTWVGAYFPTPIRQFVRYI
ncbi:hypothetical protein Slin15195_G100710 [Septoria linicola]|uniref:Uncharacterized protein n=1 Tax=Septoria linicola TaxID=215465 RepID=A0A9Q9AVN8_9PEZI|nr:hypothetical protein Slin15195_G100710 [Septoria linicola]